MSDDRYLCEGLSIKPHCAIGFTFALNQQRFSLLPKLNKSIGYLSRKAKARMTNSINWMIFLSEGKSYYSKKTKSMHKLKINFITLTLSARQMHDDKFIVEHMLKPFLKWMRRQGNTLYVWRAETQGNGNIHFHVTSNKYIHYQSIRNKWNSLQEKQGYIREYIQSGGDENPNSTDVHGVKDIRNLTAYMVKYMSKSTEEKYCTRYLSIDDKPKVKMIIGEYKQKENKPGVTIRREVECKVWNCSTDLMNRRITISQLDEGFNAIKSEIERRCEATQIESIRLFDYPNQKFRDGIIDYTCEQIAINEAKIEREAKRRPSSEVNAK